MKYLKNHEGFLDFFSKKREDYYSENFTKLHIYNEYSKLKKIPKVCLPFPDSLLEIDARENYLTELPELPPNLTRLSCVKNKLDKLPELPDSLEILDCSENDLIELPKLPKNLKSCGVGINNNWNAPIPYNWLEIMKSRSEDVQNYVYSFIIYTPEQIRKFKSYEFQKQFLIEQPERYRDLEQFNSHTFRGEKNSGYAPGIEEEFDYLFKGEDMGLL